MMDTRSLAIFQGEGIRRTWLAGEWHFSVVDTVRVLTESPDAKDYWYRLKKRELESSGIELSTFCRQLKLLSADGKQYATDCANTESLLRIIQSIPSKKAEPFKQWLAKVGYERVKEIENPELAQRRMKELYKAKGYPEDWVEKRVRGMAVRDELTDEWDKRGVKEDKEYAILTAEISKATFGITPSQHKTKKRIGQENLRDHMNDLELIFTMLGEASTTKIARKKDAHGFFQNKTAAQSGGIVAGIARHELEKRTGEKVVSEENYLHITQKKKGKLE